MILFSDVITDFLVDAGPWADVLYSHSLKCVPLIEGMFKMPLLIFLIF
jgi:hypothetical protein